MDGSTTTPQLLDDRELEILIIATIAATSKRKKNVDRKKFFKFIKDSLETGLTRANFNGCQSELRVDTHMTSTLRGLGERGKAEMRCFRT